MTPLSHSVTGEALKEVFQLPHPTLGLKLDCRLPEGSGMHVHPTLRHTPILPNT